MAFSTELEQIFQQIYMEPHKRPQVATAILRKKNKLGGIILPDIKLYYKAIEIKIAWCWHKNKYINEQRNGEPEVYPHLCGQLIFKKRGKNIQWDKDSLFNKWC